MFLASTAVMRGDSVLALLLVFVSLDARRGGLYHDNAEVVRADGTVVHLAHEDYASINMANLTHAHEVVVNANRSSKKDAQPSRIAHMHNLTNSMVTTTDNTTIEETGVPLNGIQVFYDKLRYFPFPEDIEGGPQWSKGVLTIQRGATREPGALVSWSSIGPKKRIRAAEILKNELSVQYVQWVYYGQDDLPEDTPENNEKLWVDAGITSIRLFKSEGLFQSTTSDLSDLGGIEFSGSQQPELLAIELFGISETDAWYLTVAITSNGEQPNAERCKNVPMGLSPSTTLVDEINIRRTFSEALRLSTLKQIIEEQLQESTARVDPEENIMVAIMSQRSNLTTDVEIFEAKSKLFGALSQGVSKAFSIATIGENDELPTSLGNLMGNGLELFFPGLGRNLGSKLGNALDRRLRPQKDRVKRSASKTLTRTIAASPNPRTMRNVVRVAKFLFGVSMIVLTVAFPPLAAGTALTVFLCGVGFNLLAASAEAALASKASDSSAAGAMLVFNIVKATALSCLGIPGLDLVVDSVEAFIALIDVYCTAIIDELSVLIEIHEDEIGLLSSALASKATEEEIEAKEDVVFKMPEKAKSWKDQSAFKTFFTDIKVEGSDFFSCGILKARRESKKNREVQQLVRQGLAQGEKEHGIGPEKS